METLPFLTIKLTAGLIGLTQVDDDGRVIYHTMCDVLWTSFNDGRFTRNGEGIISLN